MRIAPRRLVASAFAVSFAALVAACSAAPDSGTEDHGEHVGTAQADLVAKCSAPMLDSCTVDYSGTNYGEGPTGGNLAGGYSCDCTSETVQPAGWSHGMACFTCGTSPAAVPSALAKRGCTPGMPLVGTSSSFTTATIWACPLNPDGTMPAMPATLGSPVPACQYSPDDGSVIVPAGYTSCEEVLAGRNVPGNGCIGNPASGWFLVEQRFTKNYTWGIGSGCTGGCDRPYG